MDSNIPKDKDLSEHARRRLQKLAEVGLSKPSEPPRTAGESAIPTPLVGGRTGWLQLHADEQEFGYKGAEVFEKSPWANQAILSALTVLEAQPIGPGDTKLEEIRKAARLRVAVQRAGLGLGLEEFLKPNHRKEVMRNPCFKGYGIPDWMNARKLSFHEAWLKYYRPDFDALPDKDKVALLIEACKFVNEQLEAARRLQTFFERGGPGGLPKHKGADPELDIWAAELRDALGLEWGKIGEILGKPLPKAYYGDNGTLPKYDHQEARNMGKRGRKRLKRELKEEGYDQHIEARRPDLKRWHSLSEDDKNVMQFAESLAEAEQIPLEEALKEVAEIMREMKEALGEE